MKFKIERIGGRANMQHLADVCSNCASEEKCRRREFSDQAWSVLVLWNEIQTAAVDQPICDSCYDELREVLIDRADEVDAAVNEPKTKTTVPRPKAPAREARPAKAPAARSTKVRRAG